LLIDPGAYSRTPSPFAQPTAAVFLDRDGVIVEETYYLHRIEDIVVIPQARPAIARLNEHALAAVVVTNQAGIGRGYYQWSDFEAVQAEIERRIQPARVDAVLACGYHPDGKGELARDHPFRKPQPGMLQHAARVMNLNLANSWIIGDKLIDLEAGIGAGLAGAILVRTGYGLRMEPELASLPSSRTRIEVAGAIADAVEIVIQAIRPL
jgi:D-glycero-D-manno-heptose 1,7-bisphosphate phosphatase